MRNRRGSSWFEVLVIVAFAMVGVGLVIILISRQRDNGLRVQCEFNLKRMGDAFHAYHEASAPDKEKRTLPPARIAERHATWAVLLAPFLQKDAALARWDLTQPYVAQETEVRESRLFGFFCPARRRTDTLSQSGDTSQDGMHYAGGLGDYASVTGDGAGENGAIVPAIMLEREGVRVLRWQSQTGLASLTRGTSYTFLVGEKHVTPADMGDADAGDGSLYHGQHPASFSRAVGVGFSLVRDIETADKTRFGSWHRGVCLFLLADTSVRAMGVTAGETVLGTFSRRGD